MYVLSILIFIISSSLHLYASYRQIDTIRNITKVFIVSSLMLLYYTKVPNVDNMFIIALFFSWLGDVLLIFKGNKFFTMGGISFIISHIFFIISYSKHIPNTNHFIIVILACIIYFVITFIIFKHLTKYLPKPLVLPMFAYLMVNAFMNCAALSLLLSNMNLASLVVFIGAISFYISDSNLFFVRFKKELKDQNHFIVMFTYIIAELLIVIGIINI